MLHDHPKPIGVDVTLCATCDGGIRTHIRPPGTRSNVRCRVCLEDEIASLCEEVRVWRDRCWSWAPAKMAAFLTVEADAEEETR